MKQTLLFTLLALLGLSQMLAQEYEYVPFVREGVKWVCFYENFYSEDNPVPLYPEFPCGTVYYKLELRGDTVINGKSYKAMHKYYSDEINQENDTIPAYLREENQIVYALVTNRQIYRDCPVSNRFEGEEVSMAFWEGREFVLYNFQNPASYYFEDNCVVDTTTVGSYLAKRYGYSNRGFIVEGVGFDGAGGHTLNPFDGWISIEYPVFSFSHLMQDGQIIYKGICFDPNWTGVDEAVADQSRRPLDENYYDLTGRTVGKEVPTTPGIYIHQGKKVCVSRTR